MTDLITKINNLSKNTKAILIMLLLLCVVIGYNFVSKNRVRKPNYEQIYMQMMRHAASQGSDIRDTKGTVNNLNGTFNTNRI